MCDFDSITINNIEKQKEMLYGRQVMCNGTYCTGLCTLALD
jgi:hypothetical protein